MQAETLTLSVDAANSGSPANQDYRRVAVNGGKSLYIGDAHTSADRDQMNLFYSAPTRTGNFKGVEKISVKFTLDVDVEGVDPTTTNTAPVIGELSFSVPVGATDAQLIHVAQKLLAFQDSDTLLTDLRKGHI